MNELLMELREILESDEIEVGTDFIDLPECDSLSLLSIIVAVDAKFGVNVTANEIRQSRTCLNLLELVEQKKGLHSIAR